MGFPHFLLQWFPSTNSSVSQNKNKNKNNTSVPPLKNKINTSVPKYSLRLILNDFILYLSKRF